MAHHNANIELCSQCDLMLRSKLTSVGEVSYCPRCGKKVRQPRRRSVESTLAASIAGLVLLVPAFTLPILTIQLLGNSREGTLLSGVLALAEEGMIWLAILVFLASILFPALKVTISFLVSAHLYLHRFDFFLPTWMRYLHHLEEWAMLEVYCLGIIVAWVKLADVAEIKFGYGLYAFIALLIVNCILSISVDEHLFWRHIKRLQWTSHGH